MSRKVLNVKSISIHKVDGNKKATAFSLMGILLLKVISKTITKSMEVEKGIRKRVLPIENLFYRTIVQKYEVC